MNRTISLTDTIKSEADLREQYKDSSNLNARAAIYRFGTGPGFGPDWVFEQMLAEIPARAAILELGCGPGTMWRRNLARVPIDWRVLLTDLMPGMVDEARTAVEGDSRFRLQVMDAQTLDLPDASVDAVVACHMLYHVPEIPRAMGEIRRVLKPNGILFASTNSENHCGRFKQLMGEYLGDATPMTGKMPFSLENGATRLAPFFANVERRSLPGELRITIADAVVRYILSVEGAPKIIVGAKLAELHNRIAKEIREKGAYVVSTEAGMFIARAGSGT